MEDFQGTKGKRIRLVGSRFNGGLLPIDSLAELQKYQEVLRIAVKAEWRRNHPDEDFPINLLESVNLTIQEIKDGSSDIFMVFEQQQIYSEYREIAQDAVDAALISAYSGFKEDVKFPNLSPEEGQELREALSLIGGTLTSGQSLELYSEIPGLPTVLINVETRKSAIENLALIEDFLIPPNTDSQLVTSNMTEVALLGRVTILEAERKKFTLVLPSGEEIRGWYNNNPELIEDLRGVIDSAAEAPLTRVYGTLIIKDGKPSKINPVSSIERIEFDDTVWGARLAEFASLMPGWNESSGQQISSTSLDAAQIILRSVSKLNLSRPGIFPTDEGGVLIEWADSSKVVNLEITNGGNFELFTISSHQATGNHSETADVKQAINFVTANLND